MSASVFYANKIDGVWKIVYAGQDVPDKATAEKYSLPQEWLTPTKQ